MVAGALIESDLDDTCIRLYAWLELRTGGQDWQRSVTHAAKELGRWPKSILTHAEHLKTAGLIELERLGDRSSPRMRIVHQPAREDGPVKPDVTLSPPVAPRRARRPTINERTREHASPKRVLSRNGDEPMPGTPDDGARYADAREHASRQRAHDDRARVTTARAPGSGKTGSGVTQPARADDGRLGRCDVCGKRWAFGACAHGGPADVQPLPPDPAITINAR
jgi:hypothetical protein